MALPTSTHQVIPTARRRFPIGLTPVLLALFLLAAGCSSTSGLASLPGTAGPGSSSAGSSGTGASGDTGAIGDTGSGDTSSGDTGSGDTAGADTAGGGAGSSDLHPTRALNMQIRVVNLWIPKGAQQGGAIDVWAGSPKYGGKKLKTIAYGTASEFFPPETEVPLDSGSTSSHEDYQLIFYAAGKTDDDDELITQNGTSSPAAKWTYLAMPNDPDNPGLSMQAFLDNAGSDPKPAGSLDDPPMQIPAGKAVFTISAAPMRYRGADPTKGPAYVASSRDGHCLQYIDRETGKVHDDPNVSELVGGTSALAYVVNPGAKVRINLSEDQISDADQCAGKAALDGIDPGTAAGQQAYGFIYGVDEQHLKILVVPTG